MVIDGLINLLFKIVELGSLVGGWMCNYSSMFVIVLFLIFGLIGVLVSVVLLWVCCGGLVFIVLGVLIVGIILIVGFVIFLFLLFFFS